MDIKTFNYITLKKEIDFPNSSEVNIIEIKDNEICYEIIFKYNGASYKVDNILLPLDKYNDFDYYFQVLVGGLVEAFNVVKVEVSSYEWRSPSKDSLFDKDLFEKEITLIENELSLLSMSELGDIVNYYGKKHREKTIKEIYDNDIDFVKWVKSNNPEYTILNKYVLKKERSRMALILYYESKSYLKSQGR